MLSGFIDDSGRVFSDTEAAGFRGLSFIADGGLYDGSVLQVCGIHVSRFTVYICFIEATGNLIKLKHSRADPRL